jgi:hypothetical protein
MHNQALEAMLAPRKSSSFALTSKNNGCRPAGIRKIRQDEVFHIA